MRFSSSSFLLVYVNFHVSLYCRPRDVLVSHRDEGGNCFL
jgi:hypothetical protein